MYSQNQDWKTLPSSFEAITPQEDIFLSKYSSNKKESILYLESIIGLSYNQIMKESLVYVEDNNNDTPVSILIAIDVALRRCIPKKNSFYDSLMSAPLQEFVSLIKDKK